MDKIIVLAFKNISWKLFIHLFSTTLPNMCQTYISQTYISIIFYTIVTNTIVIQIKGYTNKRYRKKETGKNEGDPFFNGFCGTDK
jgi:hypothetical protein